MEQLLTAKDVMKILHCGYDLFIYFVDWKQLPAWKIFGSSGWRCRPEDLDNWIKKQRDVSIHEREENRRRNHIAF